MRKLRIAVLACVFLLLSGIAGAQDNPDARVNDMSTTLRLRQAPTVSGAVITELAGSTALKVTGRTANNSWLKVETYDGQAGWVSASYLDVYINLADVPVSDEAAAAPSTDASSAPATVIEASGGNGSAHVITTILRLRAEPSLSGGILRDLPYGTALQINGRSENGAWYNVSTPDGQTGWVYAAYVSAGAAASNSPAAGSSANLPPASSVVGVRAIYQRGQALGNQRNVFSKVGDSITVSEYSLDALGRGQYSLGAYGGLQWVIDTFAPGFNSFTHGSVAAGTGWTSATVLDPGARNTAACNTEISPLECELNNVHPAIALIEFGTNDVQYMSADQFAYNLNRIVDICIDKGVVPVLATVPTRQGFEASIDAFNNVVRNIAASRGVPLWDVKGALDGLPNRGLSGDGIHPSTPPGGWADSANFANGDAMQAGYVARNLTALQVLERTLSAMGG